MPAPSMTQQGHKRTSPQGLADQAGQSPTDQDRPRAITSAMAEDSWCRRGLKLVPAEAVRVRRRLGNTVEPEELESLGRAALVDLVRRFEPGRVPFEAYLRPRLRWAMIDGVRRHTHGRTAAARARALSAADSLAGAGPDEA